MGYPGNGGPQGPQGGSDDDITKVGALSDGFANTATNSTEVDDSATGYVGAANGDNRNNDYDSTNTTNNTTNNTDNSTDVDVDAKIDVAIGNGNDRNNDYDWSYDSKASSDDHSTTTTTTTTSTSSDYDWSYDAKSYSVSDNDTKTVNDNDTDIKQVTDNDTDIKQVSDNDTTNTSNSHNSSESFYKSDTDFAVLEDVKDFDNLGIAGRDLTFNLGDDFSFTLDVDSILNGSLNGDGNNTGFSVIQANHLADQDIAYDIRMNNEDANNNLKADGGMATGADGVDMDGKGWDLTAGDDISGTSTANASAILANSGFHMELVQGANMLSNAVDSSIVGGNSSVSDVGEDTAGS